MVIRVDKLVRMGQMASDSSLNAAMVAGVMVHAASLLLDSRTRRLSTLNRHRRSIHTENPGVQQRQPRAKMKKLAKNVSKKLLTLFIRSFARLAVSLLLRPPLVCP